MNAQNNLHLNHHRNSSQLARLFSWVRAIAARLLASSSSRGLYL